MSRWRKVEVKMWLDEDVRSMSAPPPNGQTLWLYLLTGPRTLPIPGVVVAREAVLADDLGWSLEGFREAYAEAFAKGLVKADWKAGLVVIRKALLDGAGQPRESNKPESPNVLKGWAKSWDEIPECPLKTELLQTLGAFAKALGVGFAEAFGKAFGKALAKASPHPLPNQEREREQERESDLREPPSARARARDPGTQVPEGDPAPPDPPVPRTPVLRTVPPDPDPDPMGTKRKAILAAIAPLHVEIFNRVRTDLELNVRPMMPVGDPAERVLRDLLLALPSLEGVEDDCRHVLAVREAEARDIGSVKFLGASVWNLTSFGKARSMSVAEVAKGDVASARAGPAKPKSALSALLAAAGSEPGDSS